MKAGALGRRVWNRFWRSLRGQRRPDPLGKLRRDRGDRAALLLVDPSLPAAARRWRDDLSTDRLTEVSTGELSDLARLADRLAPLAPQDLIVVALGDAAVASLAEDHRHLFVHLAPHLRPRGSYVVDRGVGNRRTAHGFDRGDDTLARFVKDVEVSNDVVVVTKRGRHALTIREEQVTDLLPARDPGLDVSILEVRPAGRLDVRLEDTSYGPSRAGSWPDRLTYPEMTLRHYAGRVVSTGAMRLRTDDTILPESFRWPHAATLRHPHYDPATPSFVRLDRREPETVLYGDFYYVDCLFSGHFGHLTTEVLCRLWGWDRARRELPDVKLLFHTNPARGADGSLERQLFAAYGVPDERLVSSDRPVALHSVVGASPMWHNKSPFYAHPDIRETWDRLTTGLLAGRDAASHERIFVSRGASLSRRRGCRNQGEVEAFFAGRGFHILYPEELSLPDQAGLFAGARVVAGFGGSAMFNLMHCRRLEAAVVISHHAYVARNEHLFASVLGGQLHYFWQPSDVPPPAVGRNKASSGSSFAFDFAAYGEALARVLAGL
jgi:capsular polysaccharide biosynthesis protein